MNNLFHRNKQSFQRKCIFILSKCRTEPSSLYLKLHSKLVRKCLINKWCYLGGEPIITRDRVKPIRYQNELSSPPHHPTTPPPHHPTSTQANYNLTSLALVLRKLATVKLRLLRYVERSPVLFTPDSTSLSSAAHLLGTLSSSLSKVIY